MADTPPQGASVTKTVLHVLPHPGGGGDTYVDALAQMGGYRFERTFLAAGPRPTFTVVGEAWKAQLRSRRFNLLHVHGEVAAACMLPAIALRPSIVTLHGLHLLRRVGGRRRTPAIVNLRLILRSATRTICVSEAEQREVMLAAGRRLSAKTVVIHNGVEAGAPITVEERGRARMELGISPHAVVGTFVGSLEKHKDPLVAARATTVVAREGNPIVLVVAGDGPLREELAAVAVADGAVHCIGHRQDVRAVLAAGDFFVLPSQREGLSFALLEAMALGLPVVVSDAPGNPEAVGDAGIVVPQGDVDGFAAAFRRLLDPEVRRRLGNQARRRIIWSFSEDEMVQQTRDVYDRVLANSA